MGMPGGVPILFREVSVAPGPLLETRNVIKRFTGVIALKGVSFAVETGTIHGLLGENGAGKSTLVKIIAGMQAPTEGEILLDGTPVVAFDVKAMEGHGVFLVTQEPAVVNELSVAENLMLGRWPRRGVWVDSRRMYDLATQFLEGTGLDPRASAGVLSAVDRRKLNILRALHSGGRLIILDEPTTALTTADRRALFDFMRRLKANGVTFLFISHYNEEILEICDSVSVLRDGVLVVGGQAVSALDSEALSTMVLGRGLELFHRARGAAPAPEEPAWRFLDIRGRGLVIDRLDIRPGEIVGFAGLPGSGAQETGRALYGLLPVSGTIAFGTQTFRIPTDPATALKRGIAYLSDDRLKDGIITIESIRNNIVLSSLSSVSVAGFLRPARERSVVERFFEMLAIKARSPDQAVAALSGGNQQKVCLSRLLATGPKLLILNEPTRGIDVGVKEEVHRIVDRLARSGVAVIIVTSDLDEMLRTVDRVILFVDGRPVGDRAAASLTKDEILREAFSTRPGHTVRKFELEAGAKPA